MSFFVVLSASLQLPPILIPHTRKASTNRGSNEGSSRRMISVSTCLLPSHRAELPSSSFSNQNPSGGSRPGGGNNNYFCKIWF